MSTKNRDDEILSAMYIITCEKGRAMRRFFDAWAKDYAALGIEYIEVFREMMTQKLLRRNEYCDKEKFLNELNFAQLCEIFRREFINEDTTALSEMRALVVNDYFSRYRLTNESLRAEEITAMLICDNVIALMNQIDLGRLMRTAVNKRLCEENDLCDPIKALKKIRNMLLIHAKYNA